MATEFKKTNTLLDVYQEKSAFNMIKARNQLLSDQAKVDETIKLMNENKKKLDTQQKTLKEQKQKKQKLDKELANLQEKANKGLLTDEQRKRREQAKLECAKAINSIKDLNESVSSIKNQNNQAEKLLNSAYTVEKDSSGNYSLKKDGNGKLKYKNPISVEAENVLDKLQRGQTLTDDEVKELRKYQSDDLMYKAREQYLSKHTTGYNYNISKGFNEKLYDIRNYKNFRSTFTPDYQKSENFTTSVQGGGTCPSRSFYMSKNDFLWSENFNLLYDAEGKQLVQQSVQNIVLNEYQPVFQYSLAEKLVKLTAGAVAGLIGNKGGNVADQATETAVNSFANRQLNEFSINPGLLYDEQKYSDMTNPMKYLKNLFTCGQWLNTYELPFISQGKNITDYLQGNKGDWKIGTLADNNTFSGLGQAMTNQGVTLSLPSKPTFSLSSPIEQRKKPITLDFYLINKNDQWLSKNFEFMHALFAGSQWLQMTMGMVVPTNVYYVLVPGRFQIGWAQIQTIWKTEGKLRTNQYMYTKYNANGKESKYRLKSVQANTLWPEAWTVSITINPLTQWNFNTYIDYFVNGFGQTQIQQLNKLKWNFANGKVPGLFQTAKPAMKVDVAGSITPQQLKQNMAVFKKIQDHSDKLSSEEQKQLLDIVAQADSKRQQMEAAIAEAYNKEEAEWQIKNKNATETDRAAHRAEVEERKKNQISNIENSEAYQTLKRQARNAQRALDNYKKANK